MKIKLLARNPLPPLYFFIQLVDLLEVHCQNLLVHLDLLLLLLYYRLQLPFRPLEFNLHPQGLSPYVPRVLFELVTCDVVVVALVPQVLFIVDVPFDKEFVIVVL